jgi:hypothetical protein
VSEPTAVDDVVFGRHPAASPAHGRVGTGEHELAQIGVLGDVKDVAQTVHVGAKQRRRVAQPRPGVDDAVVHVIATLHCPVQRGGVEDVAVESGELQIVDAPGVGGRPHHRPDVGAGSNELAGDV